MPDVNELIKDITDQLYWDDRVDATEIRVEVDPDGLVHLLGKVPSYQARQAAYQDAQTVAGVSQIKNELVVEYPSEFDLPDEQEVVDNVSLALKLNSQIDERLITVSGQAGWVTLEGTVGAFWKKVEAEELAWAIAGVIGVTNDLAVVPTRRLDDQVIALSIKNAMKRHADLRTEEVEVEVADAVVTLNGVVTSLRAYAAASDAASFAVGVTAVNNNLILKRD